jgi:hypothetical protein
MATEEDGAALPYHEPGIETILIITSFLLLLNVGNWALDRLIYVGLLGQVFLGISWGTPGAKWLGVELEGVVVNLGYLGLLLLVYEGERHCIEKDPVWLTGYWAACLHLSEA